MDVRFIACTLMPRNFLIKNMSTVDQCVQCFPERQYVTLSILFKLRSIIFQSFLKKETNLSLHNAFFLNLEIALSIKQFFSRK
jgi:hypothetical protein